MHSPGPSASDIQSHLYASFLQASTYDVALRVTGTWNAIYKLHRVVLIQSGFFRSLFTGGFSESAVKLINLRNGTDEISVIFDDLNITRPAFEVCISRLYGGGPALHISPNLIPTTNHPLTPPFFGVLLPEDIPAGSHPATPLFLQSLLATAIYLSIPSVASQALTLILKTVGPTTVLQYLKFACGKTVDSYSEAALREPEAAVGLENVAQLLDDDALTQIPRHRQTTKSTEGLKVESFSDLKIRDDEPPVSSTSVAESSDSEIDESAREGLAHHYGALSDKIGEACSCWLARWATDMLQLEIQGTVDSHPTPPDTRTRSKSLSDIEVVPPVFFASKARNVPIIWGRNGLNAKWVAAIISADTLFVKNERERYNFARSVVELRRQDGVLDDEERIWAKLFECGIYYANMAFEDLMFISQDISPTSKRLYVSPSTLQAAHWTQSILRHIVTQRPNLSGPFSVASGTASPPPRDKELGIALTTAELLSKMTSAERNGEMAESSAPYFPVLGDSSVRIGDNGTSAHTTPAGGPLSMEELFNPSQEPPHRHPKAPGHDLGNSNICTTEGNFFGIMTPPFCGKSCVDSDATGKFRWSPYPPYRFSVEFWDVDLLKEKLRLHSQTIWHAGSLFNVYVQIVRKKGQAQLGIYLHRQSHVDPTPASSAPYSTQTQHIKDGSIVGSFERPSHLRQPSLPSMLSLTTVPSNPIHYSPSIHPPSRSSTPSASLGRPSSPPSPSSSSPSTSPLGSVTIPATLSSPAPQQPYRDPRSSISAYFSISCASAIGSSQTRFSSSPDVFSVSQSWGWKSSTLRTEDFVEVGSLVMPNDSNRNDQVSLRATVLLGLV